MHIPLVSPTPHSGNTGIVPPWLQAVPAGEPQVSRLNATYHGLNGAADEIRRCAALWEALAGPADPGMLEDVRGLLAEAIVRVEDAQLLVSEHAHAQGI